jgi:hypothetical protein
MTNTAIVPSTDIPVAMDEAAELLEAYLDAGDNVFLWGAPGIGKTDLGRQLATKKTRPMIEFHAALRDTVDLRGIPVADLKTNTTKWLVPDELPREDRDGPDGYLFCDEYNQASPQMQAVLGGLILYGTVGDYRLPPGWRVIAAGNRMADRASAQRMPTQARNRFAHITCVPTVDSWVKWANTNDIAPELVAFVRFRREEILHRMPRGDENAFPTPRSLAKCSKYVAVANVALRQKLFAGLIGADVAGELNGFIQLYQSIGSLDAIIKNPSKAPIPTDRSQLYATCTGLARMATRANFANVCKYADRLTGDYPLLLVHDAVTRDASLKNTAAYGDWAVNHQQYILQSAA